ncbi:hypothetical protein Q8F55_001627 [Vanrija albida]|uniref:Major facilitator superfamily (MFS) profile domain-containing protein n=1 Tax=Vanrija albida TaxID=181172 RepID=A0ABR3QGI8_9TREE
MVYTGGSVLYVGPIIDGILGGNELLTSVYTAYMADVTSVDNISINTAGFGVASSLTAMVMPMVGPFLVASTGDRLLPFKIGLVLQILLAVFVGVIVPESLSVEAREHHVKVAAAEHAEQERLEAHDSHDSTCHQRFGRRIQRLRKQVMRHILAPLDALSVFMPKPFQDGRPGRDWNLFCIAAIVFLVTLSREEGPEIHYTIFAFGWGQGELGRRMSLLSTWRTVTVLSIIPFYRFVLKPWLARRMARRSVSAEETPLLLPPDAADDDASPEHDMTETRAKARADLGFLGTSLLVEMLGYLTMGVNAGGSVWQYAIGKAGAIAGSQGTLVIEPLLLELGPKEQAAGRLFGASAVVSTIGGTFFNSLLFNSVLWATIGSYAPALFLVAALLYLLALVFVAGIRAPKA